MEHVTKMKLALAIPIIIVSALFDQLSKYLVITHIKNNEIIVALPNVLHFVYLENTGITFGLFNNLGAILRLPILIFIPLGVMAFLIYMLWKVEPHERIITIAYSLILGGAIGNIFDRIFYGYVVDFIQVNIYIMWWPAFNIADSVIVIGMALLCIEVLRGKQIFETKRTDRKSVV